MKVCPIARQSRGPEPAFRGLRGDVFGPYWVVVPVQPEPSEVVAKFVYLGQQAVDQFGVEASAHVAVSGRKGGPPVRSLFQPWQTAGRAVVDGEYRKTPRRLGSWPGHFLRASGRRSGGLLGWGDVAFSCGEALCTFLLSTWLSRFPLAWPIVGCRRGGEPMRSWLRP